MACEKFNSYYIYFKFFRHIYKSYIGYHLSGFGLFQNDYYFFFLGSKLCQVLCAAEMETWKKILSQRWFAAAFLYSYSIRCHYNRLYIISLLRVSERYSIGLNSFIENDGLKKKKNSYKITQGRKTVTTNVQRIHRMILNEDNRWLCFVVYINMFILCAK